MSFRNAVMAEFMVPREPGVTKRLWDFYFKIGWQVQADKVGGHFAYVRPLDDDVPVVGYWFTRNFEKRRHFVHKAEPEPSPLAVGLRLPVLNELVEVCLIVPGDETVQELWDRGGKLLEAHSHVPIREHEGAQEFRFGDPFNYALRVTADPGYQIERT